jgi:hypothetical protein
MYHVRLCGLKDSERSDVARPLGEYDVARVEEDPGYQVDRLLAADRDHDVVGRGAGRRVDPGQRHDLADAFAQRQIALTAGVLERRGALFAAELRHHLADRVERQGRDERGTTGERDDLGPAGHGEERADLRGGHPADPMSVPIGVIVERRPGHLPLPGARFGRS